MNRRRTWIALGTCVLLLAGYALAGFALVPMLLERQAPRWAADRLNGALSIGETHFNPFLLRLAVADLRLTRGDQPPLLSAARASVDLGWASLWQPGWQVSDLRLEGVEARIAIGDEGLLEWPSLLKRDPAPAERPPPRVVLKHAAIQAGRLAVTDRRGAAPVHTALTGIEMEAFDIRTTAPQSEGGAPEGRYRLKAALSRSGTLSATGSLTVAPHLQSSGDVALTDIDLPALWPLVSTSLRLDMEPPAASLEGKAHYAGSAGPDAAALAFDGVELTLAEVSLKASGSAPELVRLHTLAVHEGQVDVAARTASAQLEVRQGAVSVERGPDGQLNWLALRQPSQSPQAETARAGPPPLPDTRPWQIRIAALQVEDVALHALDRDRPVPLALDVAGVTGHTGMELDLVPGGTQVRLSTLGAKLDGFRLAIAGEAPEFELGSLSLSGGAFNSSERRISFDAIAAQGGHAAFQLAEGAPPTLVQALQTASAEVPQAEGSGEGAAPRAWHYAVGSVRAEGMALVVRHQGFSPAIAYRGEVATASLENIDSGAEAPMQLQAHLNLGDGGSLRAEGTVAQNGATAQADLQIERLPLMPLQPALARQARLTLRSGTLSAQSRLELRRSPDRGLALQATGTATLDDVRIDEDVSGDRFLAWRTLKATGLALETDPGRLSIREVDLVEPGAKLVISEDNSVNLTRVLRRETGTQAAVPSKSQAKPSTTAPFAFGIERIRIRQGVLDYADNSLVLPFSTQVTKLEGTVLGVSTEQGKQARVQANGEIEPYGSARVTGTLLPFAPKELLDLRVRMNNVAMPPLSPYTATFAGRKVAEGKLWLDLDYHIENGQLLGENKIKLADFRLGERVEAPNALDLPLEFALALLTDDQGRVELAVPVRGEVGNPEFALGAVVREAVGGVLKRIVTAPFRALGNLFDGQQDESQLARIEFRVGSDNLMPPQKEKLQAVARAIAKRPQLQLIVSAPYAPERDAPALRRQAARLELARLLGEEPAGGEAPGLIAFDNERTQQVLDAMLARYAGTQDAQQAGASTVAEGRAGADRTAPSAAGGAARPDRYREVFARIVSRYPLPDAAAQTLAARRADAIRRYLVDQAGAAGERIKTGTIQTSEASSDRTVSATLGLEPLTARP